MNSINPKIFVGGGVFVFDIAWIFGVSFLRHSLSSVLTSREQFTVASVVYYTTSVIFPASETMIDAPILDDHDAQKELPSNEETSSTDKASDKYIDV